MVDSHYAGILEELKEMQEDGNTFEPLYADSIMGAPVWTQIPESLYTSVIAELNHLQDLKLDVKLDSLSYPESFIDPSDLSTLGKEFAIDEDIQKIISELRQQDLEQVKKKKNAQENLVRLREGYLKKKLKDIDRQIARVEQDKKIQFETIVVSEKDTGESDRKWKWKQEDSLMIRPSHASRSFTIRIPDFSLPDRPKIIQYQLNPVEMENKIQAAFHKNLLLTIGLFAVSLLGILFVSRKFLQPIGHLQTSFDRVVQGNLDVAVPVKSRDEIGDLTQSFNHMVEELRKNREKEKLLQQKERLASMGQLAAGVAHEIKNPLNAIYLTIDHLKDRYAPEEKKAMTYIETIQSEINRLDKLVDDFLNFVRSEHLQKRKSDVNGVISDVLELLRREIESSHIAVEMNLQNSFMEEIDPERMKTVLLNIILNAVHAMPEGGRLKISSDEKDGKIVIQDNGRGIPIEDQDKIFDLFYTTKSKGTGLGLPTAYKIIREHGGEISLKSNPGEGTTVTIFLKRDSKTKRDKSS